MSAFLPVCDIPRKLEEDQTVFSSNDKTDYNDLCNLIISYVGADCWAVAVNDEILFNLYEQKPYKDELIENYIREKLYTKPSTLLFNIMRKRQDAVIHIYMFSSSSYRVQIEWKEAEKVFEMKKFVSESYNGD